MVKSRKKTILTYLDCRKVLCGGRELSNHVRKQHGYDNYNEYRLKTSHRMILPDFIDINLKNNRI